MAKIVKTLTVSWQWSGDKYSLRGFNLAVTPAAKNPKEEVVATAFVETKEIKQTYSYKMGNVTLDKDAQYKIWVQAVYENSDSDWVATGGATVSDDGSATIITKTDREIQDIVNMASDNILTRQEKISLRREWQEIVYEFLEIESTAISQGIPSSNTVFSNFKSKGNALGTYLNGGTAWTISSNNKTSFPLWINDSNLGNNTSINGNTYRETFRVYYEAKVKILEEINKYKVNNVQVGGVNLLVGTATAKNTNVNVPTSYVTWDPYTTHNKQTLEQLGFKVGDKVTIGFDWSISKNGTNDYVYGNFRVEFRGIKSDGTDNQYLGVIKNPAGTFSSSNTKGRVEATVALDSTTIKAHSLRFRIDNSVLNFKVSNLKMERGTKATGWSPALEEMENAYTVILTNEAQVIPTNSNRVPTSSTTYFTDIQVYKGTTQRNDYTIGTINSANGITVSKTSSRVNFVVSTNTALAADGGNFIIPITIDGKTFNKTFSWSCSKQGNTGATGNAGQDAITIVLSNENHTFPCESNGNIPTTLSTTCVVTAYKGGTSVTPTIGAITNPTGMTITKNGATLTIQANTGTSLADSGTVNIPISVDGKTFNKTFTWSKAKKGATGATGATGAGAKTADIIASSQVFKSTDGGLTFSPTTITMTPKLQNVTYSNWQYSTNGGSNWNGFSNSISGWSVSGSVLTINKDCSLFTPAVTSVVFRLNTNDSSIYDTMTIVKLYDIADLEIGGRNYLQNSNFANGLDKWTVHDMSNNTGTNKSVSTVKGGSWADPNINTLQIKGTNVTGRYGVRSSDITLVANTTYTISGYCAGHRVRKIQVNVRDKQNSDANIHTVEYNPVSGGNSLSEYYKFETTFTTTSNTLFALNLYAVDLANDGYTWFANIKLEKGNKASDWTPAPEDVATDIDTAKNEAINSANNTLITTIADYYTKEQTNSQIDVAKEAINLGVSSTYETKANVETKVTSTLNSAKSYSDTKKTEAINAAATDATNKVNSAKNELNTAIGKKANSSDVYSKAEVYTKGQTDSAIKVAKDEINLGVSNTYETKANVETKITSIQVGGTNLAYDTNKGATGWGWGIQTNSGKTISGQIIDGVNVVKMVKDGTSGSGWNYVNYGRFKRNKITPATTYMASFEIKSNTSFNVGSINLMQGDSTNSLLKTITAVQNKVTANSTSWNKIVFKLTTLDTLPSSTSQVIYITGIPATANATHYIRNLKLEEGNKATIWSPAPEDITTDITTAKNDAISSAATDATNKVNSAKNELNTAIGKKANSADVYTKTQVYTKDETNSQINIAKDAINLGVSNTYETKTNVETKITSTLNNAKSYADTKKTEAINSAASDATNKVNSAKNELNTKIDGIQVGGRNLIKNSNKRLNGTTPTSVQLGGVVDYQKLKGKTVTLSMDINVSGMTNVSGQHNRVGFELSMTHTDNTTTHIGIWHYVSDGNYNGRKTRTLTVPNKDIKSLGYNGLYIQCNATSCDMGNVKLEEGNKATSWTPAPEDVNSAINKKANSSDVYVKSEVYTKAQTDSQIKVAKDEINLGVSNTYETKTNVETKVNNINFGIRNLARPTSGDWASKTGFNGGENQTWYPSRIYLDTLSVGDEITYSFDIEYSGITVNNGASTFRLTLQGSGNSTGWTTALPGKGVTLNIGSGSTRISNTFKLTAEQKKNSYFEFGFRTDYVNGGTIKYRCGMATKGNRVVQWSPAPEDITTSITNAKNDAINTASTDATNKVNSAKSALNTEIGKKANSADVYKKTEVYTKNETNSQITAAKNEITQSVSNTYETKTNVQTKIDAISVGGTNLIKESKLFTGINIGNGWRVEDTGAEGFKKLYINTNETTWKECSVPLYTQINSLTGDVTVSFEYIESASGLLAFSLGAYKSDGTRLKEITNVFAKDFKVISTALNWKTVSYTFNPSSINGIADATEYRVQFKKANGKSGEINVRKPQVELGNKATAWSPSPLDIDATMDRLKIDGTNLITKKRDFTYGYISSSNGSLNNSGSLNSNQDFYTNNYFPIKKGESITLASYPKSGVTSAIKAGIYIHIYNTSKTWTRCAYKDTGTANALGSVTYTADTDGYVRFCSRGFNDYNHKAVYGKNVGEWSPSPLDIEENVSNLTTRMSTAEQKITDTAITNTVKQNFYTKEETNNQITSKGYQTSSQVQQTVDNLQIKFTQSGGYNLFLNSGFKKNMSYWGTHTHNSPTGGSIGITTSTGDWGFPDASVNCVHIRLANQSGIEYGISQTVKTTIGKKYTLSFYYAGHRLNQANAIIRNTNGSWLANKYINSFPSGGNSNANNWNKYTLTFTATATSHSINIVIVSAGNDGYMWIAKPQVVEGELDLPYSPHPNEVYDGLTQIDKDGIKVSTSKGAYTQFSADGMNSYDNEGNMTLGLRNGGMTFHAYNNHEYVGYISQTAQASNGYNGVSLGLTPNGDYLSFGYAENATDPNKGFSQKSYMSIAPHSNNGNNKEGINLYKNLYMHGWTIDQAQQVISDIFYANTRVKLKGSAAIYFDADATYPSMIWEDSSDGMIRMYGDNGIIMGYSNGNTSEQCFYIKETKDGLGCRIGMYDHLNMNGWRIKNATVNNCSFRLDEYKRTKDDYVSIFKASTSSKSEMNIELANDYVTWFNIQANNYVDGGRYIACFNYQNGTAANNVGVHFYRAMNCHGYNITNVGNMSVRAMSSEELEVNDIRIASPVSVARMDGKQTPNLSVVKSVDDVTEAHGVVTISNKKEKVELPYGLMFTDYYVQVTGNKVANLAVTEKTDEYFIIETDSEEEIEVFYTIKAFQPSYITRAAIYGELQGEEGIATITYEEAVKAQGLSVQEQSLEAAQPRTMSAEETEGESFIIQ